MNYPNTKSDFYFTKSGDFFYPAIRKSQLHPAHTETGETPHEDLYKWDEEAQRFVKCGEVE